MVIYKYYAILQEIWVSTVEFGTGWGCWNRPPEDTKEWLHTFSGNISLTHSNTKYIINYTHTGSIHRKGLVSLYIKNGIKYHIMCIFMYLKFHS